MARKRRPRIAKPVIARREGLPEKIMPSAGFGVLSGLTFDIGPACKVLALLVLRNSLQKRHLMAAAWMVSAQKGALLGLSLVVCINFHPNIYRKFVENCGILR